MATDVFLQNLLRDTLGTSLSVTKVQLQGGGSINTAAKVESNLGTFFVKWNEAAVVDMFEKEVNGLNLLKATNTITVPQVYGLGKEAAHSFLVLEYIEPGDTDRTYWADMGESLAALHLIKQETFGLDHDNYIGTLKQSNTINNDWHDFFIDQRLRSQLDLVKNKVSTDFVGRYEVFLERAPEILPSASPVLLHGDLWNGNVLPVMGGKACFFDPAVYRGAREMDLAMTHLFGGFDPVFYKAYDSVFPISKDFDSLIDVYNLYPLMVHVNLFGVNSGYTTSVDRIMKMYL